MSTTVMSSAELAERLDRIQSHLEIQQLPIRYGLAIDTRDLDAWVALFVPDVRVGSDECGRPALLAWITAHMRQFGRTVHEVGGHRIEVLDDTTARGQVYCRAEHEVDGRWSMVRLLYTDTYRRVHGEWLFERRTANRWYEETAVQRTPAATDLSAGIPLVHAGPLYRGAS